MRKVKKILLYFFTFLFLSSIHICINAQESVPKQNPSFISVSVHDPSIIKVDDIYYIFGSHLAAAKSKDLMHWELIDAGVYNGNKLIPNVLEELKDTFEWAQTKTLWAPHVIQLKNGKFYMYYCACKGDSPRSALGVAVSENVEGPYKNKGIILKSGMWGQSSEDGSIYDPTKHPNVVDPHVFYDKNGNLWMVYGSYSGGIFILRMDPETGMPYPNQGYGKKLLGGNHSPIEGPFILYSPHTDYYYLFLSFGGFASDGGYNIRVVRSKNPDGPYYDIEGKNMLDCKCPPYKYFDVESISNYGVKLMGNFIFDTSLSNISGYGYGSIEIYGYVSPGHNSAYYDTKLNKYFLIFHTRFPKRGEHHEVRVHQMFFNEEGWPVISPLPYAGESLKKMAQKEIVGDYLYINHGKDTTPKIKTAIAVRLEPNGVLKGNNIAGTWKINGEYYGEINIIDAQTKIADTYKGVFIKGWDPVKDKYVTAFSGVNKKGISIWLKQTN